MQGLEKGAEVAGAAIHMHKGQEASLSMREEDCREGPQGLESQGSTDFLFEKTRISTFTFCFKNKRTTT